MEKTRQRWNKSKTLEKKKRSNYPIQIFQAKDYFQQQNFETIEFPTQIDQIWKRVYRIHPANYGRTRNYGNGAVTYLGPYISRGVLSTKQVCDYILSLDLPFAPIEKLIQELAWRDYWQLVWIEKQDAIHSDLKQTQFPVSNHQIPKALSDANTGIYAIDHAIKELYETGYIHNHMRMYVASICCNLAYSYWHTPSKWMYAHLLDGDIASNQLSWQWVAGTFSQKKYYANQDNINKYFNSTQKQTFLDIEYDEFDKLPIPEALLETVPFDLQTPLPSARKPVLDKEKITLIYNYYNLDPLWYKDEDVQRILLLEPSIFRQFPVEQKCIDFVLGLSNNIKDLQLFVGEFDELLEYLQPENIVFKEHPLNKGYKGCEVPRDWLSSVKGYYPSFFSFWKQCKKELIQ